MSKMKTVLVVFAAMVLADSAYSQSPHPGGLRRSPGLLNRRSRLGGPGSAEAAKQKEDQELIRQNKEKEYWATWPRALNDEERTLLDSDFEEKFNCIFGETGTNTWMIGRGKALVISHDDDFFQKIDSNGLIVAHGLYQNRRDLEEYKWYENEEEKRLMSLQSKWAKERDMSLEEAMKKYKIWQEQSRMRIPQPNRLLNLNNRPGLNRPGSNAPFNPLNRPLGTLTNGRSSISAPSEGGALARLRERREAARKAQIECEEQKKALLQMQEELRRQREAIEARKD